MDLLTLLCIFSGIFNVRSRPRHKDENKSRKIVFHKPKKINIQLAQFYSLKLKLCTCPREKQFTNHICQASWLSELWGVKKMSKMRHSKHRSFSNKWEVNEGQKNKLKKKKRWKPQACTPHIHNSYHSDHTQTLWGFPEFVLVCFLAKRESFLPKKLLVHSTNTWVSTMYQALSHSCETDRHSFYWSRSFQTSREHVKAGEITWVKGSQEVTLAGNSGIVWHHGLWQHQEGHLTWTWASLNMDCSKLRPKN